MKPKILAIVITFCALALAGAHTYWPNVTFDGITLGLLLIALLPWLRPIMKSVELPGGLKIELQDYEQSTTENPPAPPQLPAPPQVLPPAAPDPSRLKVLATLWHYQIQFFKTDYAKRWTFTVAPSARDYPSYLRGIASLVSEGLVAISPENHHAMLTNEGIHYCEQHPAELNGNADLYRF